MHCTEHQSARTRLLQPLAAALSIVGLLLSPVANAQANQTPAPPQAQSLSPSISDEKLNAAAVAIGQVSSIRQNYEPKIAAATAPSDKQRVTDEANIAMKKAVTDQGLTVDEYNSIIRTAQNDPGVRQKLSQRIPHSGQ
jgi:Domain of unknown function (DUF4168)